MNRVTVIILVNILLFLLLFRFYSHNQEQITYTDGQEVRFIARLSEIPKEKGRVQQFRLDLPSGPKLYITTSRFPEFHYGDVVNVFGTILVVESGKREILTMAFPKLTQQEDKNALYRFVSTIRERVTILYQRTLPPVSASLLSGIVFGIKEDMPEEFSDALRQTGVMHVIAASGMNVAMVAGAVFSLFAFFLHRRSAITLSLVAIMLYAVLSGLESSIVRATVMAGIALVAAYIGRQYFGVLALFFTAYVMLLYDPAFLADVGFQLSFAATLGIMFVKPPESFLIKKNTKDDQKWYMPFFEDIQVTVAAQIATLPILLSVFGQYGLLSVPVNALVLWTIPILMMLGSTAAIVGLVVPVLALPFLFLALPFLWYFEAVVSFFGTSGYLLQLPEIPLIFVVAYYAILLAIVLARSKKHEPACRQARSGSMNQGEERS